MSLMCQLEPVLSICIPTFNGAEKLRMNVANILAQALPLGEKIEIIVSDNCSSDNTQDIAQSFSDNNLFRYHRNDNNIGLFRNLYKVVSLARGRFVWVLGNDDLLRHGAIKYVLEVIDNYPQIDYIYANYTKWDSDTIDHLNSPDEYKSLSPCGSRDLQSRYLVRLAEVIPLDPNCFTPIYCSIMRRHLACAAYEAGIEKEPFESLASTVPHAVFIAKNLLNRPCWYIGYPYVIAPQKVSWEKYKPIYMLRWVHDLLDICEKGGADSSSLSKHRQLWLEGSYPLLLPFLSDDNAPCRSNFSFARFVWRNRHYKEPWRIVKVIVRIWVKALIPYRVKALLKRI